MPCIVFFTILIKISISHRDLRHQKCSVAIIVMILNLLYMAHALYEPCVAHSVIDSEYNWHCAPSSSAPFT